MINLNQSASREGYPSIVNFMGPMIFDQVSRLANVREYCVHFRKLRAEMEDSLDSLVGDDVFETLADAGRVGEMIYDNDSGYEDEDI